MGEVTMSEAVFLPILDIKELVISNGAINVVVKVSCPADVRVRSPKVRAIFECKNEDRILPLVSDTSYLSEDMQTTVFYAGYTFRMEYLFLNRKASEEITLRFAISYGDHYCETVPFTLSRSIQTENDEYLISTNEQQGRIHILDKVIKPKKSQGLRGSVSKARGLVKRLVSRGYSLFLCILGLLLLPLFFIDAGMTYLGFSTGSKENKSNGLKWFLVHIRWRYSVFCKKNISLLKLKAIYLEKMYRYYSRTGVVGNRVSFLSSRRMDMTGNLGFVYSALLKDNKNYNIQELLDPNPLLRMSLRNIRKMAYLCATSKVILVDDFFPILSLIKLKEDTKLIQLWHACGAFKTFGFTRIGKKGGPNQNSMNHRNYDYAIVSSQEIAKYYAEGFGIPSTHVLATGIPRTDIFFSKDYKNKVVDHFYKEYPKLRDKKIILFAPTFRGNGKESAYYPESRFNPVEVYEATNREYAIIIKHHPFVKNKLNVPEEYKDYIIDLSEKSELNDLLFVTDLVITDYSSLIFEASLLNIPMLFYAYDLRRYIASRDFYYEYELFVPGKIVINQVRLIQSILDGDFETEKIETFKNRFFDHVDGASTNRVVTLINEIIENKK